MRGLSPRIRCSRRQTSHPSALLRIASTLSHKGLRRAHNSHNIFLAMSESSLIPCIAVHKKDDRIDRRDGLVSRSLWRCATGQKGALLLQRAVERVTMNLRAASDGRAEWVGFSRWLNNPNVTANEIAVHSAEVLSDRVAGLHVLAIQDTT